ncbi:MAG: hypothetical protein Q4D96_13510 [Propionibacteriaceae bacterium]|nr:hypothetical protein [Propionibacteriaceae bacterium]
MQSFSVRVKPTNPALFWGVVIGYVVVVAVVAVILAMTVLDLPKGRNRLELALIVIPLILPLFPIMWLMGRKRDILVGPGVLALGDGRQELTRIGFHEIAHARMVGQQRKLEVYDHARQLRMVVDPIFSTRATDHVLGILCANLPHRVQERTGHAGRVSFPERYVDFAPPQGMPPQPPTPIPPPQPEPPRKIGGPNPGI